MKHSLLGLNLLIGLMVFYNFRANCEPLPGAENVCNRTDTIIKDTEVETPVEYDIKIETMCGLFPCTKTRKETKMNHTIRKIKYYNLKSTCCPGYTETPDRQCAPICLKSCNTGKCVAPNVCQCHPEPTETSPGYVGPTCGRFTCLAPNKWGPKCNRECTCHGNSYCSASTGKCLCYPGWRGANCTIECNPTALNSECEDNIELLPIAIEPEVNVIEENMVRSAKLIAPDPLGLERESLEKVRAYSIFGMITIFIILVLLLVVYCLLAEIKKLRRQNLSYPSYNGRPSEQHSNYSDGDYHYSNTTDHSQGSLDKNLNFNAATRTTVLDPGMDQKSNQIYDIRRKPILAPIVESHMIRSQKASEQNLYSEIDPNFALTSNLAPAEEHIYQIPKSPKTSDSLILTSGFLQQQLENSSRITIQDENDNESGIYEEIKPRAPEQS